MLKRIVDLLGASIGLILLLPVALIVTLVVWLNLGSPVFFAQYRPGQNGQIFRIFKFRSMRDERDIEGYPETDEQRMTRFGQFLRSTSLDEIPELWNVLKGDMSLVGPRPLLTDYLALYSAEEARRHEVKPGLTGWAQVNGRNALSWEEKLKLDVWYVDNQSFWLDVKILLMTLKKVLMREGITAAGSATTDRFTGGG